LKTRLKRSSPVGPNDKKLQTAAAAAFAHIDQLLDEALEATFPASDPVAINIELGADERERLKSLREERQG
jgi:hypothetical protein